MQSADASETLIVNDHAEWANLTGINSYMTAEEV